MMGDIVHSLMQLFINWYPYRSGYLTALYSSKLYDFPLIVVMLFCMLCHWLWCPFKFLLLLLPVIYAISFETERSTELLSFNSIHSSNSLWFLISRTCDYLHLKRFAGQKTIDKSMMMTCGPKRYGWQATWRMALGHGDAVRFIGPLWGETTADHWIDLTRR